MKIREMIQDHINASNGRMTQRLLRDMLFNQIITAFNKARHEQGQFVPLSMKLHSNTWSIVGNTNLTGLLNDLRESDILVSLDNDNSLSLYKSGKTNCHNLEFKFDSTAGRP